MNLRTLSLLLVPFLGCSAETPARDQWLVEVTTDAPTPLVGDRLLIEALDEEGDSLCDSCRRQFGLSAREPWPVSFGIASEDIDTNPLVRVRLYRVSNTGERGLPLPGTTLDTLVRLPSARGVTRVGVELHMRCLGVPSDVRARETCDPESGRLDAVKQAGPARDEPLPKWDADLHEGCAGSAPEGSVCIPSGAFIQGDASQFSASEQALAVPERVVVLSPFFLDQDEFRVGDLRELLRGSPSLDEPRRHDPETAQYCSYLGPDDDDNDTLALNCVSQSLAADLCAARGMRLPTEAEWEFAAGNRDAGTRFPWGDDEHDPCSAAIHGLSSILVGNSYCRFEREPDDQAAGPRPGTPERDVTALGVGNLAGGMSEWTRDSLVSYDDPCWGSGVWLTNPTCELTGAPVVIRGSSWDGSLQWGAASSRNGASGSGTDSIGFRCAKDGDD